MLGGHSAPKPADPQAQQIADSVRQEVEQQTGTHFETYQVICYTSQVVAGTNYKLKVEVDGGEFIHLKVFAPLPHTGNPPELSELERNKTRDDPF